MNPTMFSVNGRIGYGAYEKPQFPTARSFIAHLDYLDIDRSLVWHTAARDLDPLTGNRMLVQEITESGLEERLLPTFIVTPACFYQKEPLDFIRANFAENKAGTIRVTPEKSRFPIREIERVLNQLVQFEPVLLWDCPHDHNALDMRDIEYLAKLFPQLAFVITQKMWGGFSGVLDLMWRCANVYVDTSWLHMRDTLELLVDNYTPARVLFGIGCKSHYGAAVAALMHARLTHEQRELIAHANLESLLKISPLPGKAATPPPLCEQKPLWNVFRSGRAVEGTEIIDAHGHTPPHTRGWVVRRQNLTDSAAVLTSRMDNLGVDRLIVSAESALFGDCVAGNLQAEQLFSRHGDRFSGYLVFNPLYADEMEPRLDEFFERGFFVGFKILPSYWKVPVTDSSYQPVWQYAHHHRRPVLLHTWDDKYNSPAMLTDVVSEYPQAAFILGHSGGGTTGRLEAEELALKNANVFLEFCGSFTTPLPFEETMRKIGRERVVFGSDTSAHDQAWKLGRFLSLPVPDEELRPGLAQNIRRILQR